jgi:SAM-dependent methyltransferase
MRMRSLLQDLRNGWVRVKGGKRLRRFFLLENHQFRWRISHRGSQGIVPGAALPVTGGFFEVVYPRREEWSIGPLQVVVRIDDSIRPEKVQIELGGRIYPGFLWKSHWICLLPVPEHKALHLRLRVETRDGGIREEGLALTVTQPGPGYREGVYELIQARMEGTVLKRENIYGFGPPNEFPHGETLELIAAYGGTPILDVGCGIGAYMHALIQKGFQAVGIETNFSHLERASREGLDVLLYDGKRLPFADGAFDTVMAVEVMEHVTDWKALLMEMLRVCRRRVLITTPDIGVLHGMARHGVVPWHLLESTHVNFFTPEIWRHIICRTRGVEGFAEPFSEHAVNGEIFRMHVFALLERIC